MSRPKLPRALLVIGVVATIAGAIDPLEGSVLILFGVALATLGAFLFRSRYRVPMAVALALVAAGVGALFGLSALGGIGGDSGRSMWWAVLLVPYVAGWVLALVESVRVLREQRA